MLIILLALLMQATFCSAFFSTHGLRSVIQSANRVGDAILKDPMQLPISLNISEEDAINELTNTPMQLPRIISFQADTNTSSTEKPEETTTTTMSPFDDPNFIPGDFLDSQGSARFVPEPPVFDLLADVVKMISEQTTDTWMVVIIVIFGNIIFLIFGLSLVATITILTFSQYQDAVFPLNRSKKGKPTAKPHRGKDLQKGIKPRNAAPRKPQELEPQTEEIQERKLPRSNKPVPNERAEAPEAQSEMEEIEPEEPETEEPEPEEPEPEEPEPEEPEPEELESEEPEPEDPEEEDPEPEEPLEDDPEPEVP